MRIVVTGVTGYLGALFDIDSPHWQTALAPELDVLARNQPFRHEAATAGPQGAFPNQLLSD